MRNLLTLIALTVFNFNTIFSQSLTAFSHLQEQTFEMEIPDSLFVVYGERMRSTNNIFIDRDETISQYDILLASHPGTCEVFLNVDGDIENRTRINLESAIEVFFGEDLTQNFDLENQSEILTFTKYQVHCKFKVVEIFKVKSTKLIFLDVEGNVITSTEFYDRKFHIQNLVKHFFKQ